MPRVRVSIGEVEIEIDEMEVAPTFEVLETYLTRAQTIAIDTWLSVFGDDTDDETDDSEVLVEVEGIAKDAENPLP